VSVATFADLKAGEVGLLTDSYGLVAVALNRRSAAGELGLGAGDPVRLEPSPG
jgi:S-adenosylmethionine hydrolase